MGVSGASSRIRARLPAARGHPPDERVQREPHQHRRRGVTITSNLRLAQAPGNVPCRSRETGLTKLSVVNVSQVATIDKKSLLERVGTLPARLLADVEQGVRLVLGL